MTDPTPEPALVVDLGDRAVDLGPGDVVTFGRDDSAEPGEVTAHLGLSPNPRLHAHAGVIEVAPDGWTLRNTGRWLHLGLIEIGGPNRADLAPGRALRVPYHRCRVEVSTGDEVVGFEATCPALGEHDPVAPLPSGATVGGLGLDRSAGYFRALVALCEPRLRDPASDALATTAEIARALNGSGAEPDRVTAKAVERRLAHVRRKLSLGAADPYGGSAAGLEARDAGRQLADLLLRTGTVTAADLELLEPEGGGGGEGRG
jgi:hypothetical protein